jgi:dolichol-phosphate mannosyltransferase
MAHRYLVIIPAYNEEATIERVVRLSKQYADVCVVDDASTDDTPRILARLGGKHIRHQKNTHIAGAILDGMRYALEAGYDYCITMDAGMSHDPNALPQFLKSTGADLVIGYRERKVNVPLYRKALSLSGTTLINLALARRKLPWGGAGLRDATSGYRMYSRNAFGLLLRSRIKSRSFDFHLESLARVYNNRLKITEVPIVYIHSNSSLRWPVIKDALRTLMRIWVGSDFRAQAESEALSGGYAA